jgi:hypothetical protein
MIYATDRADRFPAPEGLLGRDARARAVSLWAGRPRCTRTERGRRRASSQLGRWPAWTDGPRLATILLSACSSVLTSVISRRSLTRRRAVSLSK